LGGLLSDFAQKVGDFMKIKAGQKFVARQWLGRGEKKFLKGHP
jgi:hypothetical protein